MKKFIVGFITLALLTACASDTNVKKNETEPIMIGAIGALTGEGAPYGILTQHTAKIRVDQINAAGGINGRNLELIWEDGKCNPGDASKAAQKLIGVDKVSIIFGGVCSGETLGAAPITEKKDVILLSSISTSAEISAAGDYVFRTAPSDAGQGKMLAKYASDNFKKVGILVEQTDYAVALADVFTENFTGEVVTENFLTTEADFHTRIAKLKESGVDALFVNANTPNKTSIIYKQLEELGWDTPLLGNEWILDNNDVLVNHADFIADRQGVGAEFRTNTSSPDYQRFVTKYEAEFGEKPLLDNYACTTLDAIDIMAQVLGRVSDVTDTDAIRDELQQVSHQGFSGLVEFDENGDVRGAHELYQFNGTEVVPLNTDR